MPRGGVASPFPVPSSEDPEAPDDSGRWPDGWSDDGPLTWARSPLRAGDSPRRTDDAVIVPRGRARHV
ncbi:hypothetical protein GCM10023204_53690 [Actinomycetospora succinea]